MVNRRMSVCVAETKETSKGRKSLMMAEWGSLLTLIGLWAYFMYEVLRPNDTNHINMFGITFYKGTAFEQAVFNAVIYLNLFSVLHIIFMLASKHSNRARALCGYNNVDSRQSTVMTILTAVYFNMVFSVTVGLGDFYAVSPLSMALCTIQAGCFYFLGGAYIYSLFFRHTFNP